MAELVWNEAGGRRYELGADRGVLYHKDVNGDYTDGEVWNGLKSVTRSPSGGEPTKMYADNRVWLTLLSVEEFSATIECMMYPKGFERYDGLVEAVPGVLLGQQPRGTFGFAWRTLIGNDLVGQTHGYKIHLAYECLAKPTEQASNTINESPETTEFSYELSTTPVPVTGYQPTAYVCIDSTRVSQQDLAAVELVLYGSNGQNPQLPLPDAVLALFDGAVMIAQPTVPTYNWTTDVLTIPTMVGVEYLIDDEVQAAGPQPMTATTNVVARPTAGYYFGEDADTYWQFVYA
jgi:hypothetical protein